MTREEAVEGVNKAFEPAFANYIITALTEGATVSDKESTTKNCESCRYYGSHHEACNYCYKCSLWTEKEPRKGHWKHIQYEETLCCSECGCRLVDEQTYIPLHYYPNCGADMREGLE